MSDTYNLIQEEAFYRLAQINGLDAAAISDAFATLTVTSDMIDGIARAFALNPNVLRNHYENEIRASYGLPRLAYDAEGPIVASPEATAFLKHISETQQVVAIIGNKAIWRSEEVSPDEQALVKECLSLQKAQKITNHLLHVTGFGTGTLTLHKTFGVETHNLGEITDATQQ